MWDYLSKDHTKYTVDWCLYFLISCTWWLTEVDTVMHHSHIAYWRTCYPSCLKGCGQTSLSCQPPRGPLPLQTATSVKAMLLLGCSPQRLIDTILRIQWRTTLTSKVLLNGLELSVSPPWVCLLLIPLVPCPLLVQILWLLPYTAYLLNSISR